MPKKSGNEKYPRLEKEAREVITEAKKHGLSVVTSLEGYTTKSDMLVLFDLLRYASSVGVQVVFEPVEEIKGDLLA